MADTIYDMVIIGGGPGGYTTAIRAGQYGLKVALVEREKETGRHLPALGLHSLPSRCCSTLNSTTT